MWKGLIDLCVRVCVQWGVVQGQSSRKCPGDEVHELEEGEQSEPGGSLTRLMVRSNWSIRSPTSRLLMAD